MINICSECAVWISKAFVSYLLLEHQTKQVTKSYLPAYLILIHASFILVGFSNTNLSSFFLEKTLVLIFFNQVWKSTLCSSGIIVGSEGPKSRLPNSSEGNYAFLAETTPKHPQTFLLCTHVTVKQDFLNVILNWNVKIKTLKYFETIVLAITYSNNQLMRR